MLLAHHPEALDALPVPTPAQPWRVLVSGCLARWPCGVDGSCNGSYPIAYALLEQPYVRATPFCPEAHTLGVPRGTPDLHGGDGRLVLLGRARALDEHGADVTEAMLEGARAMRDLALRERVHFALLMDMSAACGSQVLSDGARSAPERRYQRGVGVATALLLEARVPVVSQRDFRTLARLRARAEPGLPVPDDARDHHEHPWTLGYFGPHREGA